MRRSLCVTPIIGRLRAMFRLALLGGLVMLSGCANVMVPRDNELYWGSRFAELETYLESQLPDLQSAGTSKLIYLCSAYYQLKKYNKLFPCLDQADRNAAKGDRGGFIVGGDVSWMLQSIRADAYIDLGRYDEAIETARQSYDYLLGKRIGEQMRIYPLSALALAYALKGDREQARHYLTTLDETSSGFMGAVRTPKLTGLARTHLALGDYAKCLSVIEKDDELAGLRAFMEAATLITGAVKPGDSVFTYDQLPKLFILNKCRFEAGRVADAKRGYERLMAMPQTQSRGGLYWVILFDYGRALEQAGNREQALDYYRQAINIIEQQRSTISAESSKIGFVGDKQQVYERAIALLVRMGQGEAALGYVERAKARALVDMLAAKTDFAVEGGSADQVHALLARADAAETQSFALDDRLKTQTRSVTMEVRSQLAQRAPELASLVTVTTPALSELRKRLAADESLVEYYYGGGSQELYAFVMNASGVQVRVLSAQGLVEEVQSFRKSIESAKGEAWREDARRLHARLIAPLDALPPAGTLTIIAHGALHYLPFNALHDGQQFLVERYRLRLVPAASVLAFLKSRSGNQAGNILAFGNPDLNNARYDLAFAQAEAESIVRMMPRSRALTRAAASKAAFRQYAGDFRYLHVASHGRFDAAAPLRSALLLAGEGAEDGQLTVGELYSMRLAADLVTLSACETGLGRIENGDDVVGLTRGFLYAGARSIVASLWQVDDQATGELMKGFYDALRLGVDNAEALRRAEIAALRRNPHPFYWAAFQLTGADR